MGLLENIWFITAFSIISIILLTDPKASSSGYGSNPLVGLFASTSTGEKFVNRINWALIFLFFVLTTLLSLISE